MYVAQLLHHRKFFLIPNFLQFLPLSSLGQTQKSDVFPQQPPSGKSLNICLGSDLPEEFSKISYAKYSGKPPRA